MAVECNPDGLPVDEFIDSLVKWKIMGLQKLMDEVHIRYLPGAVNLPPVNCPYFDDPVGIAEGERQRGPVEIDNHPGDGCINISDNTVTKSEHNTSRGIAIVTEFVIFEQQKRAYDFRDLCTAVRD
jgi:hypothetical protein